jgi:hypothetical protein
VGNKLKMYRVFFDIDVVSYRDVEAFDEDDAREQAQGDRIVMDDFERAGEGIISVDLVKPLRKVKKALS